MNKSLHGSPNSCFDTFYTDVYIILVDITIFILVYIADASCHVMSYEFYWKYFAEILPQYLFEFSFFSCACWWRAVIQEISSCISSNCTLAVLYCTYWLIKSSTIKCKLILFLNNSSPPPSWFRSKYRMKPVALVDNYSINVRNTGRVKVLMFCPEH